MAAFFSHRVKKNIIENIGKLLRATCIKQECGEKGEQKRSKINEKIKEINKENKKENYAFCILEVAGLTL